MTVAADLYWWLSLRVPEALAGTPAVALKIRGAGLA